MGQKKRYAKQWKCPTYTVTGIFREDRKNGAESLRENTVLERFPKLM